MQRRTLAWSAAGTGDDRRLRGTDTLVGVEAGRIGTSRGPSLTTWPAATRRGRDCPKFQRSTGGAFPDTNGRGDTWGGARKRLGR